MPYNFLNIRASDSVTITYNMASFVVDAVANSENVLTVNTIPLYQIVIGNQIIAINIFLCYF